MTRPSRREIERAIDALDEADEELTDGLDVEVVDVGTPEYEPDPDAEVVADFTTEARPEGLRVDE